MPAPGQRRALTPDELELLRAVARRPVPGPLRRSPQKDRLRRMAMIEAVVRDRREGQDTAWHVTAAGHAEIARLAAA